MNSADTSTSICTKPEIIVHSSPNDAHEMLPIYMALRSWLKSNSSFPLVQMGPSSINVIEYCVPISWRILWYTGVLKDRGGKIKESPILSEWALTSVNKNPPLHCGQFHFQVIDYYMLINYEMRVFVQDLIIIRKVISAKTKS